MATDIRAGIAARRAEDIKREGAAQGLKLPGARHLPLNRFPQDPPVICEVKRYSPSVNDIDRDLEPAELARSYLDAGVMNISVLTEQNFFGGSLKDLIIIKTAMPEASVLRKDFLLSEEDVEISFLAGADAFLLIASLLTTEKLESMYRLGVNLGMTPLVELHSPEDIQKAAAFRPGLVGINSRDLRVFKIRPLQPLRIRAMINWDCRVIYESGVKTRYDADFVRQTGFSGVLVGEAAVRNPGFAGELARSFTSQKRSADRNEVSITAVPDRFSFWDKLYGRSRPGRPLVKICGITSKDDLLKVAALGADMAGFILAESPRKVSPAFIESCRDVPVLKVGVVVLGSGEELPADVRGLLETGALDAVQFHGDELPEEYTKYPGYKAVRLRDEDDVAAAAALPGPVVLVDAFSSSARGGTGKRIESGLVEKTAAQQSLWLAGGINPDNAADIISSFHPEMVDISSGVESAPGIKDHAKLERLFRAIDEVCAGKEYTHTNGEDNGQL